MQTVFILGAQFVNAALNKPVASSSLLIYNGLDTYV